MSTIRHKLKAGAPRGAFAYSNLDALLVLITFAQLGFTLWGVTHIDVFSWAGLAVFAAAQVVLTVTQYHVVIHNFIHTPFFRSKTLNAVYAVICSITVMSPFSEQALEHLNHHKHVNDKIDPVTNTTRDSASTYRFGKDRQPESIWRYALLSPLRQSMELADYSGRRSRLRLQLITEAGGIFTFWIAIGAYDWQFLLLSLAVAYAAQTISSAQNLFEHYGATPENRLTDSVSCYGQLYNLLWFNNGYHQEHHYRPGVHWTKVKDLRCEMLPDDRRRIITGVHFMNFPTNPNVENNCR